MTDQTSGQSLTYTRMAGRGISWNQARVGAEFGCTSWASCGTGPVPYNAPPDPVTLASISGVRLTSYSGHRAGLSSWWTHSKIEWTRNGKTNRRGQLEGNEPVRCRDRLQRQSGAVTHCADP